MSDQRGRREFAARAPRSIPDWFQPAGDFAHSAPPPLPECLDRDGRLLAKGWRRGVKRKPRNRLKVEIDRAIGRGAMGITEGEQLQVWCMAYDDWRDERDRLADERQKARIAQWPWAWADLILSAEGVGGPS